MHFTTTVHHGPDFLLVEGAGPALLTDLCGYTSLEEALAFVAHDLPATPQ